MKGIFVDFYTRNYKDLILDLPPLSSQSIGLPQLIALSLARNSILAFLLIYKRLNFIQGQHQQVYRLLLHFFVYTDFNFYMQEGKKDISIKVKYVLSGDSSIAIQHQRQYLHNAFIIFISLFLPSFTRL